MDILKYIECKDNTWRSSLVSRFETNVDNKKDNWWECDETNETELTLFEHIFVFWSSQNYDISLF